MFAVDVVARSNVRGCEDGYGGLTWWRMSLLSRSRGQKSRDAGAKLRELRLALARML
jgi:hypothetical protein